MWIVAVLSVAAALLFPVLALAPLIYRNGRIWLPFLWLSLIWIAMVGVGAFVVLRHLSGHRSPRARRIQSREERSLAWTGVAAALLAVLVRPRVPHGTWVWLWIGCAALAAVLAIRGFRRVPAAERRHIKFAVYGAIAALLIGVPADSAPAQFRRLAVLIVPAVAVAAAVLMMLEAGRQEEAPDSEGPATSGR